MFGFVSFCAAYCECYLRLRVCSSEFHCLFNVSCTYKYVSDWVEVSKIRRAGRWKVL